MRHVVPAFLFCILLFSGTVTGAAPLQETIKAVEAQAYRDFINGDIHEGAVRLIELARALPDNDASVINDLIGPAQLLGFAVASLMDPWPERHRIEEEVLRPDEYPTDKLLIAVMKRISGVQSMALTARFELMQLTKSKHQGVRATALFAYGEPFFSQKPAESLAAASELLLRYPELELTRHFIELPVYERLDKSIKTGAPEGNLLENILYWGGRREMVLQASPGLAKAAEALPSLNLADIDDNVVGRWAAGLAGDSDPRSRYTVTTLIEKSCTTPERRARARAGLEALAKLPPATPDVVRARMMLADFARLDHESKALQAQVQDLLSLEILPCTVDRFMYEDMKRTIQNASRYFMRLGLHAMAIQAHEGLGRKFPNSALAEKELKQAEAIREDALKATLAVIEMEMDAPFRNGDLATLHERYRNIIDHTEHGALRAILIEQRDRAEREIGHTEIIPGR